MPSPVFEAKYGSGKTSRQAAFLAQTRTHVLFHQRATAGPPPVARRLPPHRGIRKIAVRPKDIACPFSEIGGITVLLQCRSSACGVHPAICCPNRTCVADFGPAKYERICRYASLAGPNWTPPGTGPKSSSIVLLVGEHPAVPAVPD